MSENVHSKNVGKNYIYSLFSFENNGQLYFILIHNRDTKMRNCVSVFRLIARNIYHMYIKLRGKHIKQKIQIHMECFTIFEPSQWIDAKVWSRKRCFHYFET